MRAPSRKEIEELMSTLDALAEVIRRHKNDPEFKTDLTEEKIEAMREELLASWEKFKLADREKKAADAELKAVKKKRAAAKKKLEKYIGKMDHKQN
ncbi:MAG: hypothetical protein JXD23_09470 [Spirochaetales bacterium]|nr:hypothetical protein [Spirochaetales bacterium]